MDKFEKELNEKISKKLKELISERGKLTNVLYDVLGIDKTAAYRRLRNEIPFTFAEIAKLSEYYSISLDELIGMANPYRGQNYHLYWQNFYELDDTDFKMSEDYINAIRIAGSGKHSEFGVAATTLPLHILVQFPNLYRFTILKWMYQFGKPNEVVPYAKIQMPQRLLELHKSYYDVVKTIKETFFITDENSLEHLIKDIRFFNDIRLVSDNERELFKNDLAELLNKFEQTAISGYYDTGNKVELFTTELSFETTYSYVWSDKMYIAMVDVFTANAMSSVDYQSAERMRNWIGAMVRTSTPLTGSEKNRILYMEKQRSILEKL
jgi:hypothetical protein